MPDEATSPGAAQQQQQPESKHGAAPARGQGLCWGVTPKPPAVPTDLRLRQTLSGRSLGVSAGTFQSQTARKPQRRRTSQPRYLGTETVGESSRGCGTEHPHFQGAVTASASLECALCKHSRLFFPFYS